MLRFKMARKLFLLPILHGILLANIFSQNFTIEDIEIGRLKQLASKDLKSIQWRGFAHSIAYIQNDTLFQAEFLKEKKTALLSLEQLNGMIRQSDGHELPIFPQVKFYQRDRFCFLSDTKVCEVDLDKMSISVMFNLPEGFDHLSLNKQYSHAAFTLDSNVFVIDREGLLVQVTFDSVPGITNGQIVYRNEFGSDQGIFWSPEGSYFAFYHDDLSGVSEYPLVRIDRRVAELENTRYPMAGMISESTEVFIYSLARDTLIRLQIESGADDYHTNLSWSPDETQVYIQHLNREQNLMVLRSYSIPEGHLSGEYFNETDKQYVEPLHPLVFNGGPDRDFYYQSMRDGYNHLYFYRTNERKLEQLTRGAWEITEFLGADQAGANLFFLATKENPLERQLYKYHIKKKIVTKLTTGEGTHDILMSSDGSFFIDIYSSMTVPRRISVLDPLGKTRAVLLDAPDPVVSFDRGEVTIGTLKAGDDTTDLFFRLVKPVDFDPTKKYPVIVYVYGGPHLQLITNSWMDRIDFLQQYFAQHGYISFTVDPRGSRYRGAEFEQVIHRQSGIPQAMDQMKGIEFLKTLDFVDTSRIGVHGWSYGGYMTIYLMLTYPEIFKVGVAGGPVTNWKYYEVMYGERYMDTPAENPDGYAMTDLSNYAHNLQGKLLIIHGALDPTVVWQHSLVFLQACIKQGVQPDYFVYPLHEHNVRGTDRVHLTRMITSYFFEHL